MPDNGLHFSCTLGDLPPKTLFELTLTLSSPRSDIDPDTLLLQPGSFTVTREGAVQRRVNGIIAEIIQAEHRLHTTEYQVTLRPPLWRLTLKQDSRIFHHKTVPEILQSLLLEHDVLSESKLYDPHAAREYVTQKRETDYAFFCRLAAEEGISFWCEETPLFYSDDQMGMRAGPAMVFNPDPSVTLTENVISRLAWGRIARPDDTVQKDRWHGHPEFALSYRSETHPRAPVSGKHSLFESSGRFQDHDSGQQFTGYRRDVLRVETQYGQAHSNCIALMPGRRFDLSAHPIAARNTYYQVVSAHHHGNVPDVLGSGSGEGTRFSNRLQLVSGYDTWRPPFQHKPLADGDEVATVVGPAGEEIFVNEQGAIKVHFHWNRYDNADEHASCWVRVAQAWNGNGYGFLATPRIGQEVIISYLNGDVDRPIVTGCNYNAVNRPPLTLPAEKTRTTLRTQTHKGKGFNELRFDDENEKQEIYIHAQKDHRSIILNDQIVNVGHSTSIDIQRDSSTTVGRFSYFEVKDRREELSQTDHQLKVGGHYQQLVNGNVHIEAGKSVRVETQTLTLQGTRRVEILGPMGKITIDDGGVTIDAPLIKLRGAVEVVSSSLEKLQELSLDPIMESKSLYKKRFRMIDQQGKPYSDIDYLAVLGNGEKITGRTDINGYTQYIQTDKPEKINIDILLNNLLVDEMEREA